MLPHIFFALLLIIAIKARFHADYRRANKKQPVIIYKR